MACSILTMAIFVHPVIWGLLYVLVGISMSGMFMVIESWLNERTENEFRGRVFSVYAVIVFIASIAGQQLLGFGTIGSFELFSVAAMMAIIALVPTAMTKSVAPVPLQSAKPRFIWGFTISPIAIVSCILVGFANGSMWSLAPVYARFSGLSFSEVGWFMTAIIAGGAISQWPIGRLSDRFDRRVILLCVAVFSGLTGLSLVWIPITASLGILLGLATCYGVSLSMYSLCAAHINDLVEKKDFVHVAGVLLLSFGIGAVCGPIVSSIMMDMFSHYGLFMTTAAAHGAIACYTFFRLVIKPRTKPENFDPFVVTMPKPSPVVSSLDPRIDAEPDEKT
jgi:MFS family permease